MTGQWKPPRGALPLEPGEIRIEYGRGRRLRCLPGDGDYEEMRVNFEPGVYVPGKGRVGGIGEGGWE